ncbi:hypothetical protein K2F54_16145 [Cryobacterium sp. 1639]|uniref:hypothetical protein n=1 Tax=Cryobacterium inferilacus TaxID=2866629 RepID=UPI001C732D01|nr:hypothetical protein [Cryobacterium sp. 1639]MBX0301506.1 hypothetical protein [Cryobacterium sp. 1639]
MTYQPAPAPAAAPSQRSRRWVHAVPGVMIIAVLAVAAIAGIAAFVEANGDSVTRPAAPFQAILVGGI